MQTIMAMRHLCYVNTAIKKFLTGVLIVGLAVSWCAAAAVPNGFKTVLISEAAISLNVPGTWSYKKKAGTIHSGSFEITVRVNRNGDKQSLADFVKKNEAFNKKLAASIKENQYYKLLYQSEFSSKSGVSGIRSVYGLAKNKPSAITYYLLNKKNRVVTVDLQFNTWETDSIWKAIDAIVSGGLNSV